MNALKKGVESTTGLNVSKETLFVYPVIGEWKMSVVSCEGDPVTGDVVLKINVNRISSQQLTSSVLLIREANVSGSKTPLALERWSADPLHDFKPNTPVDVTFQTIYGVPAESKTLDVKFSTSDRDKMFEARDVPIEWMAAE